MWTPETIRATRVRLGMTQRVFAEAIGGVAVSTVARWESGATTPTRHFQRAIEELQQRGDDARQDE